MEEEKILLFMLIKCNKSMVSSRKADIDITVKYFCMFGVFSVR